jgi:hypothetical protein
LAQADRLLALAKQGTTDVQAVKDLALDLVANCAATYDAADAQTRRQWNQTFFRKLHVGCDGINDDERAEPFDDLTDPDLPTRLMSRRRRVALAERGSKDEHPAEREGFEPSRQV